jgi:hypothetical protein
MAKKMKKPIVNLIGSGVLIGAGSLIGGSMPGTTGAPLTSSMYTMGRWMGPITTVTGAGMVMRAVRYFPKPKWRY